MSGEGRRALSQTADGRTNVKRPLTPTLSPQAGRGRVARALVQPMPDPFAAVLAGALIAPAEAGTIAAVGRHLCPGDRDKRLRSPPEDFGGRPSRVHPGGASEMLDPGDAGYSTYARE